MVIILWKLELKKMNSHIAWSLYPRSTAPLSPPSFPIPTYYINPPTPSSFTPSSSSSFSSVGRHQTVTPEMDVYGMSSSGQDFAGVDELLDFSNDQTDLMCASVADMGYQHHNITSSSTHFQYGGSNSNSNSNNNNHDVITNYHNHMTDFTDGLSVPSNDVAELEWLSNFVHDSFSDFPANNIIGTINYRPENTSFHSRSRTKRTRMPTNHTSWTSATSMTTSMTSYASPTSSASDTRSEAEVVRRCTHCASEKTPQWRTGPLGPKTLCNACGVRYKSGRLVPEYRPAASPTFVLTQHSNSHRKVMELRRQKEVMIGQQQPSPASEYQMYGHYNRNNYEVC